MINISKEMLYADVYWANLHTLLARLAFIMYSKN